MSATRWLVDAPCGHWTWPAEWKIGAPNTLSPRWLAGVRMGVWLSCSVHFEEVFGTCQLHQHVWTPDGAPAQCRPLSKWPYKTEEQDKVWTLRCVATWPTVGQCIVLGHCNKLDVLPLKNYLHFCTQPWLRFVICPSGRQQRRFGAFTHVGRWLCFFAFFLSLLWFSIWEHLFYGYVLDSSLFESLDSSFLLIEKFG